MRGSTPWARRSSSCSRRSGAGRCSRRRRLSSPAAPAFRKRPPRRGEALGWSPGCGAPRCGLSTFLASLEPFLGKTVDNPHGTADNILSIDATGRPFSKLVPRARYVEVEGVPHGFLAAHGEEIARLLVEFASS